VGVSARYPIKNCLRSGLVLPLTSETPSETEVFIKIYVMVKSRRPRKKFRPRVRKAGARRTKRARPSNRRRAIKKRASRRSLQWNLSTQMPFPRSQFVTLVQNFVNASDSPVFTSTVSTSPSTDTFRLNSPFDPLYQTGGQSAPFFSTFCAVSGAPYTYYLVHAVKLTIEVNNSNTSPAGQGDFVLTLVDSRTNSVGPAAPNVRYRNAANTHYFRFGHPYAGKSRTKKSWYIDMKKFFQTSNLMLAGGNFAAQAGTDVLGNITMPTEAQDPYHMEFDLETAKKYGMTTAGGAMVGGPFGRLNR